jgi:hypothetical protein
MEASYAATPVDEGVRAGIDRAARYDLTAPETVTETATAMAERAMETADVVVSEGGKSLFVELITVASIARYANGFDELTISEMSEYLRDTAQVVDSFFHA